MRSEDFEQMYLIDWASLDNDIKPFLIHIRNEGKRTIGEGAKAKHMGLTRGVSDLFFAKPNGAYHGFWIELKAPKGKLSAYQKIWLEKMKMVGYKAEVYFGWVSAAKALSDYVGKPYKGL